MPFDLSTAKFDDAPGFDLSTAQFDEPAPPEPRLKLPPEKPSKLAESMSNMQDSYARGAARSLGQGAFAGFGEEIGGGAAALAAKGAHKLGLLPGDPALGDIYSDIVGREREGLEEFRGEHPVASTALEVAGSLPTAAVGAAGAARAGLRAGTTLPQAAARGSAAGGVYGGTYGAGSAEEGERLEGAGKGAALGAATGGAVPYVSAALGRAISPVASKSADLLKLKAEGIQPTIGQALGGAVGRTEEKLMSVPVFGDMIRRSRNMAADDFQRAAWNKALKPLGKKLPKINLGRDSVRHVENAISQEYDDVLNKIGAVNLDTEFAQNVDELYGLVGKLPPQVSQKFNKLALDKLKSAIDENGVLTSTGYKKVESDLTRLAKKLGSSQDAWDGELAPAVRQLRENMRGMLERQSGESAGRLKKANEAWANFKVLQRAAGGVGAEGGEFSAAQLSNAVKASDASKSKGAYARGSALMQDLADPGKAMIAPKVANSGTIDRGLMAAGTVGGASMLSPAALGGLAAGSAAYTRPVQNALVKLATSRPEKAAQIAQQLNMLSSQAAAPGAIVSNRMAR